MLFKNALRRIFAPEHMIRGDWLGQPYSTKEIYSTLFRMAWPAVIETVLVGMVTFIDTIMVGAIGHEAIAAVGITTQPRLLFFSIFMALSIGVTAIVSRRRGQEDREGANIVLEQSLTICAILNIFLCILAFVFARPLIVFAGGLEETLADAIIYFKITMIGQVFTSFGMMINAAHRGCGNTRISMYTNVAANAFNILFNWLLIEGIWIFPRLGVAGAGAATLIGNIISFLISAYSISRKDSYLRLRLKNLIRFDVESLKLLTRIGSSAAAEQLFIRIGFFAYVKLVANLGTVAFATHQICMSIINLSFTFGDGLSMASSALVGQNLGRRRSDVAAIYGKATQRVGFVVSVFLFALFMFGGKFLMGMFTNEADIITEGVRILMIVAVSSPAQISQIIYSGSLRGGGDTKYVAYTSLISIGILRPLITYLLVYTLNLGLIGAWLSLLIDQYLRLSLSAFRFTQGKWKSVEI